MPSGHPQAQLRRELAALHELLSQRMDSMDGDRALHLRTLSAQREAQEALSAAEHGRLGGEIVALQALHDQRFADLARLLDERHAAQREAMQTALSAAKEATAKAEEAANKRFDSVNEFRQQLADQTAAFPTRTEMRSELDVLRGESRRNTERVGELELRLTSRLDLGAGADAGKSSARTEQRLDTGTVISVIVMVLLAAGLLVSIITK